ncbi:helix-turn-helix domain-containing protein [Catellatospora sp. KI3]|uniref:GlxA family transcriptional regulator n=1 Tax=Catellatospora sp. KI3 TaxID=3041620 RepID=UPI002482C156|nr:helix-turn-helix domain-containing protein [Catellatospora sp. KI3]MDI1462767.1 helix-turn-helix domain-containing protein [Catellatospora sp. KI3]
MSQPHRIAVLAFDGVVALDLGIPTQVFHAATDPDGNRLYEVRVCTPGAATVQSSGGFDIVPRHGLELLDWADTIIVAGLYRENVHLPTDHPALVALRAAAGRARLMSICTGAFALATAGLLDGRPAATHWAYADLFRRLFPQVHLDADVLFIDDGDILTSAGVAAGLDLCLHVVRRDHGAEVANRAARRTVVAPWRDGGQSQFIERPMPQAGDAVTAPTRAWALTRLGEPLDLPQLARHANMSVRTFTRRFREETGMSPGRWLTGQRVEHARHLLESTDLTVDQVAERAGFGTAVSMRQHLRASIGTAPLAYRRTFRPTPTATAPTPASAL